MTPKMRCEEEHAVTDEQEEQGFTKNAQHETVSRNILALGAVIAYEMSDMEDFDR